MKIETISPPAPPPGGLAALSSVQLTPGHQDVLDRARTRCGGSALWRARKAAEARDLLALSQLAPRLYVEMLDMAEALRVVLRLRVPVACRPQPDGDLVLAEQAVLGLTYPEEVLRQPLPGYAFFQILFPGPVWHPNVGLHQGQILCLGASLPAKIRAKELVLMAYGALSMQTVQIDETDAAGVMNVEAARWWQRNLARLPLSREPFLNAAPADKKEEV